MTNTIRVVPFENCTKETGLGCDTASCHGQQAAAPAKGIAPLISRWFDDSLVAIGPHEYSLSNEAYIRTSLLRLHYFAARCV